MEFKLNEKEIKAQDKFYKKCKKRLKGRDVRLYYTFTPTGIGTVVIIGSASLNIEKDITDYKSW